MGIEEILPIIALIAFVIQKLFEIIQPLLEKLPFFQFKIDVLTQKLEQVDKIYENTLRDTKAGNIQIRDEDFEFNSPDMKPLIGLRKDLCQRLRREKNQKVRRYIYMGCLLGILICMAISKFGGIVFIRLAPEYQTWQQHPQFWLMSSILIGILVGLGTKPVNDVLEFFKKKK